MASCAVCGAEGIAQGSACPRCGTMPAPELELDVPAAPAPKARAPQKKTEPLPAIELEVNPRVLMQQQSAAQGPLPAFPPAFPGSGGHAAASAQVMRAGHAGRPVQSADPTDLSADAHTLADYGEPPESWFLAPSYAWRVLKRQRELKAALVGRQAEASHAVVAVEEALVGFAERVRPTAEKVSAYAVALEDLSRAEDVLRSRDNVLAAEQDAQKARLAQVDARLAATENELVESQTNERLVAQDLASTQAGLAREEAKLKRAESELKSATARTSSGGAS